MVMPYAAGGLVKISQSGRCIEALAASRESVPPTILVELDPETFRQPRRLAFGHDLARVTSVGANRLDASDHWNAWDLHALRRS
jgi:hypothetical protein